MHYFVFGLFLAGLALIILFYFMKHDILSRYLTLKFKPDTFQAENIPGRLNYRLYIPKSSDEKKPLLLILHSRARRGNDNFHQMERFSYYYSKHAVQNRNPMFILVPQVPPGNDWVKYDSDECHPCKHHDPCIHYNQDNTEEKEEITLTLSLIKKLAQQYPIDTNRIYITGFSMGATGVWDVITRHPDFFASAAPLTGSSDTSKAIVLKNLNIWAFTGEYDDGYPGLNENMVNKINFYGGQAKHTIFPGVGHNCKREALSLMIKENWPFSIHSKK
ncbi:MAG: dienelactone hydrolase family protein [Bacteroidales bacterium]|nr:dienelactone hydrolase family protein [Bacteroidales bacterium]